MKFVFFGTPDIAASVLEKLIKDGMVPDILICNPDRPVGRKQIITPPPTKQVVVSSKRDIKIFQPETKKELIELARDNEFRNLDFGLVMAYGMIIPKEVIDIFPKGIIGIHPSLLPELRGPSPIRTAILEGKKRTGVTLYLIDEKMDHGPIIASKEISIGNNDLKELKKKVISTAIELSFKEIQRYVDGETEPKEQDHEKATYSRFFEIEDAFIKEKDLENAMIGDKRLTENIIRKIRALNPEPGVYTLMDGKRTKILNAKKDGIRLVLEEIQVEGKKPVSLE